jgi:hypothetical protein
MKRAITINPNEIQLAAFLNEGDGAFEFADGTFRSREGLLLGVGGIHSNPVGCSIRW